MTATRPVASALHEATYATLGVVVRLRSVDAAAIELIDRSYGTLRADPTPDATTVDLLRDGQGSFRVVGPAADRRWPTPDDAALDLMEQLVLAIVAGLHERGLYAVHAGAVARGDRALLLAGPSGAGKTTLSLALTALGFELLSDELAVVDPPRGRVHPYRRRAHVRPGTVDLLPGLAHLRDRPRERLGGGIAWALPHEEAGGRPDDARSRSLSGVALLERREPGAAEPRIRSIASGLCAVELLRGTWAASVDFAGTLRAVGSVVAQARCASVRPGDPMATARVIAAWFEDEHVHA